MKLERKSEAVAPLDGWWLFAGRLGRRFGFALLVSVDQPDFRTLPLGKDQAIEAALDNLAEVLGDKCEWMLTGGLSIAAKAGCFFRDHDDVDVAVHEDELGRLVEVATAHGYDFFCRVGATRISPKRRMTLYRRLSPKQAAQDWFRRFRLLRVENGWRAARLTLADFMDIYAYRQEGDWVVSNGSDMRVPATVNKGELYFARSGRKVTLRGMAYMAEIKRRRMGEKDVADLEAMQKHGLIP